MRVLLCSILLPLFVYSQADTEVLLFDINLKVDGTYEICNPENVSVNPGYDNQPSFIDNDNLLFAKTRNKQTDIAQYHIPSKKTTFLSNSLGGEYSPTLMPNGREVSAIRLDPDGKQLLYAYHLKTKKHRPIFEKMKVGYHAWVDNNNLVSFVLTNPNSLVISNLKKRKNYTIESGIGRSLHRIPNSDRISYIKKELGNNRIMSLDVFKKEKQKITNLPPEVEDICWTPKGYLLMGDKRYLYQMHPQQDTKWIPIADMQDYSLKNITRLAVSPDGTRIAIVAEVDPEILVDKQHQAFTNGSYADFERFFSEDIEVSYYPNTLKVKGKAAFKKVFEPFFKGTRKVETINRMVTRNKVIEKVITQTATGDSNTIRMFEIRNGKIIKILYIW